ncbi:hypothetical protein BGV40_14925 [Methanosarcina sp. Ant1]|nr:hypothetical protein BGV40_14925 [Methanosarcina sp. Ant1]
MIRSESALRAIQVGKAGNSVIGTIHGSSVENVYERIVHTLGVPPASSRPQIVQTCIFDRLNSYQFFVLN